MVPPWQQYDAIGVEALVLQRVDRSDDFFALQINDFDRPVVHALQIDERVLNEAIFPVLGEPDVMGARRRDGRPPPSGWFSAIRAWPGPC